MAKEKQKTIKELTETELKALAFDVEQTIKIKQQEFSIVIEELNLRNNKV